VNGGTYMAPKVKITTPIQLREGDLDLVIVAQDEMEVKADILFPKRMRKDHAKSLNITLVSLRGPVTVDAGVTIGGGKAAKGPDGIDLKKVAGDGVNGGNIKIYGINIKVDGILQANAGGDGGKYSMTGGSSLPLMAGTGGKGGMIGLCATEVIELGTAIAGQGGTAGDITVRQDSFWSGNTVKARGAMGGEGGDLLIHGARTQPPKVQVQFGNGKGGKGGQGGDATALPIKGFVGVAFGGTSTRTFAEAGTGGPGGTVLFRNAEVGQGGSVAAGDGNTGGNASAQGGNGMDAKLHLYFPGLGGNAEAVGGRGGSPGATPDIPLPNNAKTTGVPGNAGSGGRASAFSGNGGDGGTTKYPIGAWSGSAKATGGPNGNLFKAPPPYAFYKGLPPVGATGGLGGPAIQAGTP